MNSHVKTLSTDVAIGRCKMTFLRDFLGKEAEGLRELLNVCGETAASNAVDHLQGLCSAVNPDVVAIGRQLETVGSALADISFRKLEEMALAGHGPRNFDAALRWYGARVSELCGTLRG